MKNEINGIIIGKIISDNDSKVNYSVSTKYNEQQVLYWKLNEDELQYKHIPEFSEGQSVRIEWCEKTYSAYLIISESEKISLNRDFSKNQSIENQKVEKIDTLKCTSCGSVVSISNSDIVECEYCNSKVSLNEKEFETIKSSIEIKNTNKKIFDELNKTFQNKLSPGLFKIVSLTPFIFFILQILLLSWGTFFRKSNDFFSDEIVSEIFMEDYNMALYIVLPVMIISIILVYFSRKNAYSVDISFLYSFFSPTQKDKNHFQCRSCGSPLKNDKIPDFVVCPYCKSENVVLSDKTNLTSIAGKQKLSYLVDVKILHNEFKNKYNRYFIGIMIGIIIFYSCFLGFVSYIDDMREVHFIIRYIAMPFVVLILSHLLSEIALLPFFQLDDWIPKYFKDFLKTDEQIDSPKPSKILVLIPILKIVIFVLFFVTLFFMK